MSKLLTLGVLQQGSKSNAFESKMLNSYMSLNPEQARWLNTTEVATIEDRNVINATGGQWCYVADAGSGISKEYVYDANEDVWIDAKIDGQSAVMGGSSGKAAKAELLARLSEGYLYDTFGPEGQNKTVCDFVYLLYTGGNIAGRTNTKTGQALRWDLDGTVVNNNNTPAYTKNANKGLVTVSSTDGWGGVTQFWIYLNNFSGACPNFNLPKCTSFSIRDNNFSGTCPNFNLPNVKSFNIYTNNLSGTCPNFNLPNATVFRINSNFFSGTCPNFNFPDIATFQLQANNFSGTCPNFSFPNVTQFWIYINNFSGACPNFNLPKCTSFSIRDNNFSGVCPDFYFPKCTIFTALNNSFSSFESFLSNIYTNRLSFVTEAKTYDISGGANSHPLPAGVAPYDPSPDEAELGKEFIYLLQTNHNFSFTYNNGVEGFSEDGYLVLSFDDGDISSYSKAFPTLVDENVSATFFNVAGTAFGQSAGITEKATWANLLEMHNAGMDIQCHTKNHTNLTTRTEQQIIDELTEVNNDFVANGLPTPNHIAYPGSNYNENVKNWVSSLRLTGRVNGAMNINSLNHPESDLYELKSIRVDNMTSRSMQLIKNVISYAKINKLGCVVHAHIVTGTIDDMNNNTYLSIAIPHLQELINHAKTVGINIITMSEFHGKFS